MIFTIRDNVPTITLEGVNIPEFREIWMADEDDGKAKARKELAYVYHMASPKSSYAKLPNHERDGELRRDYINDETWEPSELVQNAIDKYRKLNSTELMRLLESASSVADKLASYFNAVDFDEISMDGSLRYEASAVINNLSKLSSVVKSIRELKDQVEKEQEISAERMRGNVTLSMFDDE